MKTTVLSVLVLLACMGTAKAQVGINQNEPKASLDVSASLNSASADGVLVPRMTVGQLQNKDAFYLKDQHGVLVYVTEAINSFPSAKTQFVKAPGFYYFDFNKVTNGAWVPFGETNTTANIVYAPDAPYTILGTEDIIIFKNDNKGINFVENPAYTPPIGKKIYIYVENSQQDLIKGQPGGVKGDVNLTIWKNVPALLIYLGKDSRQTEPNLPWIFMNGY